MFQKIFLVLLLFFSSVSLLNASTGEETVSYEEAFIFLATQFKADTPESYEYIDLYYSGVRPDSSLEDALQILIHNGFIENIETRFFGDKHMSLYSFEQLSGKILEIDITSNLSDFDKKNIALTRSDIIRVQNILNQRSQQTIIRVGSGEFSSFGEKGKVLEDVYNTLRKDHYNKDDFQKNELINGAIKGLTEATGDEYTTYFPPTESSDFFNALEGDFEGIGAYVDMTTPGEFIIISPISGSPAEEAGIRGGDRVTHVDGKEITETTAVDVVISWIKGPAGTKVTLTILREEENIEITVTRAKISIQEVEYEKKGRDTAYIKIRTFGEKVDEQFIAALKEIESDSSIKKIIFDLRNNPGGYLGKVSDMLSYFVPQGEATAIVGYGSRDFKYGSSGKNIIDLNKYEVIALQNGGSASASEIMVGTLKDYYPNMTIIGEKSFGKGSVQSLKRYRDGSTLKYTTARWYTGKTRTGIDGAGIIPNIELEFDSELWQEKREDNQLQRALAQ